ncbi:MAG: replication initiator protein [Microvirus sp.]|nr:MAG: replication initiator protein [Microvirus sp.]
MTCFKPVAVGYGAGESHIRGSRLVPCGRCAACRVNRAEDWANRLLWESAEHARSCFVTLTFSPECEPVDQSVDKVVLQRFFKRLRKYVYPVCFRYFACGEYGEHHGRPHYHAVIFGLGVEDERAVAACWSFGFVSVSDFVRARARYVAGYLLKEVDSSVSLFGRQRPFALMSKGLGKRFALVNAKRIFDGDVPLRVEGKPVAVPRYFRKLIGGRVVDVPESEVDLFLVHWRRLGDSASKHEIFDSIERSRKQAARDFVTFDGFKEGRDNGL